MRGMKVCFSAPSVGPTETRYLLSSWSFYYPEQTMKIKSRRFQFWGSIKWVWRETVLFPVSLLFSWRDQRSKQWERKCFCHQLTLCMRKPSKPLKGEGGLIRGRGPIWEGVGLKEDLRYFKELSRYLSPWHAPFPAPPTQTMVGSCTLSPAFFL